MGNLIATAIIVIVLFVVLCPLVALLYKFIDLPTDRKPYGIEVIYRFEGADGLFSEKNYLSPNEAIQIPKDHGNIIDDQSIEEAEIFDGSRIMKWIRDDRDNHNVLFIRSTTLLEAEE